MHGRLATKENHISFQFRLFKKFQPGLDSGNIEGLCSVLKGIYIAVTAGQITRRQDMEEDT